MTMTVSVPDDLVHYLPQREMDWAALLAAGLQRQRAVQSGELSHLAEVAEALAQLPSAEEVLALRPSAALAERVELLRLKQQDQPLTADESNEWQEILHIEHIVRLAKAKAALRLQTA
jgi:hypothetical protein